MEKYIQKSTLVVEIEKLISNAQVKLQESQENNDQVSYIAWAEHIATCIKILSLLDTLEVKEVDLNKENKNLKMLLDVIDYSFLQTDGSYDKSLTYPVIDKVLFIKKNII